MRIQKSPDTCGPGLRSFRILVRACWLWKIIRGFKARYKRRNILNGFFISFNYREQEPMSRRIDHTPNLERMFITSWKTWKKMFFLFIWLLDSFVSYWYDEKMMLNLACGRRIIRIAFIFVSLSQLICGIQVYCLISIINLLMGASLLSLAKFIYY